MTTLHDRGAVLPTREGGAAAVDDDLAVVRVGPEDWERHRDLRLAMLRDAPEAFWADPAEVARRSEEEWRAELAGPRLHLQARRAQEVLGGIGVLPEGYVPQEPIPEDHAHVVSMWVTPAARGGGLSALLMRAAAALALEIGRPHLTLDVDSANARAQRSYVRLGFVPTGRTDPREGHVTSWVEYRADARDLLAR
ncbi:GNAT family N-acetyltransferase [Brachybacterium sp. YJGR34]|uniref:GNAT family N-acetyltransferase n=1 Tax=Brachybacterium sp. YJGR34 TaxID=2059911 RepID=UPI001E37AC37|nr:GNAT family N-acetyltransferase [Brachybacterium sp. YJGR34]